MAEIIDRTFGADIYQPDRDIYKQPEFVELTPFGKIISVEKDGYFDIQGIPTRDRKYPAAVRVVIDTPVDGGTFKILAGTRITPFLQAGAADRNIGSQPSYHQPDSIEKIKIDGQEPIFKATYRMFFTDPEGNAVRVDPEKWK